MRCKNPKCEQVITSAVRQACDEVVAGTASRIGKVAMKTVNQVFVECPICFEVSEYTCHRE